MCKVCDVYLCLDSVMRSTTQLTSIGSSHELVVYVSVVDCVYDWLLFQVQNAKKISKY